MGIKVETDAIAVCGQANDTSRDPSLSLQNGWDQNGLHFRDRLLQMDRPYIESKCMLETRKPRKKIIEWDETARTETSDFSQSIQKEWGDAQRPSLHACFCS